MNKLAELSIMGYYDPSSKLVVAWFYENEGRKSDLVAYLLPNMHWDLREVIEETSALETDREFIEIKHKCLGMHGPDSDIDNIIRKSLGAIIEQSEKDEINSSNSAIMKIILEKNSYFDIKTKGNEDTDA